MRVSRLEPGDLCLIRQKVFCGKHKISDHWENTKYMVVEQQSNLPVCTIKPWQEERQTWVVHKNLLIHIAPPHKQDEVKCDSIDSEYDTPPEDMGLPKPISSNTGPLTQSQTRAHQLVQNLRAALTKAVQTVQAKYSSGSQQIAHCPNYNGKPWPNIVSFDCRAHIKCLHIAHCNLALTGG